jgi:hypothetical protein
MKGNIIIRRVVTNDITDIIQLFKNRKSEAELKWVFRNPDNSESYNAFVAINKENEIIGVIGYVISTFSRENKRIKGVIPMLWLIKQDYRGLAGILLLKRVLELGEFGFGVEGTQMAQDVFLKFKYSKVGQRFLYKKTYNPIKYFVKSDKSFIDKILRIIPLLPRYIMSFKKVPVYNDVKLTSYNGNNYIEEKFSDVVFQVIINKNFIDWLSDCPFLNTHVFCIKRKNKNYGMLVLYINENRPEKRGRIVYLPYLGTDKKIWNSVIKKAVSFFKQNNCYTIDTIGINQDHTDSLLRFGFIKSTKPQPVFIRDPNQILLNVDFDNMHMQYTEGDNAYIGL